MNKSKSYAMVSYIKRIDKAQMLENLTTEEVKDKVKFSASYKQSRKEGYINNDEGTVNGEIMCKETEASKVVVVRASYTGVKNGEDYNYTSKYSYEIFENGLVQEIVTDGKDNETKETYFKTVDKKFQDAPMGCVACCNNPIGLRDAEHLLTKVKRK